MNNVEIAARMIEEAKEKKPGWFVYMALCQDDGPIYVKVGMSLRPDRRITQIKWGNPIPIHQFYICEVGSRRKTRQVELALHIGLGRWAITGEWFRLNPEDRDSFNKAWQSVFSAQSTRGNTLRWERASVSAIRRAGAKARTWAVKQTFKEVQKNLTIQSIAAREAVMDKMFAEAIAPGPEL